MTGREHTLRYHGRDATAAQSVPTAAKGATRRNPALGYLDDTHSPLTTQRAFSVTQEAPLSHLQTHPVAGGGGAVAVKNAAVQHRNGLH